MGLPSLFCDPPILGCDVYPPRSRDFLINSWPKPGKRKGTCLSRDFFLNVTLTFCPSCISGNFEQTVGPNLEFVFLEMSLDYKLRNSKLRNRLPQEKFPNELFFVLWCHPFSCEILSHTITSQCPQTFLLETVSYEVELNSVDVPCPMGRGKKDRHPSQTSPAESEAASGCQYAGMMWQINFTYASVNAKWPCLYNISVNILCVWSSLNNWKVTTVTTRIFLAPDREF